MILDKRAWPLLIISGVKYINFFKMVHKKRHHRVGVAVLDQHKFPLGIRCFIGDLDQRMDIVQKDGILILFLQIIKII